MKPWKLLLLALVPFAAFAALWTFKTYGFQSYKIPAASMEPTILRGDHVYVDKWTFRGREPRRGELIVHFIPRERGRIEKVARVVAVPGDRVEIREKKLFLNGQPQEEPYAVHLDSFLLPPYVTRDFYGPFVVPPDHYFTLGDNRDQSLDSRFLGPIERSQITGGPRMWVYWSYDEENGRVRWDRMGRSLH